MSGDDPHAALSRTPTSYNLASSTNSNTTPYYTPTDMSFRNSSIPRSSLIGTGPPKKSTKSTHLESSPSASPSTAAPVVAAPAMAAPVTAAPVMAAPVPPVTAPKKEPTPVVPRELFTEDAAPHFDIAQNAYGTAKDVWSWGKSVPVVSNFLGLTEAVAAKLLDTTVHMDLPALDSKVATPQLKKLDDGVVTPFILAVWKLIAPAVAKSDELVIRPVLKEVVPRMLVPLGMFAMKKEDSETNKAEERKATIDMSPTPEVVPVLN